MGTRPFFLMILAGCSGKEKRYSCFLDARLRKDDHRGCISVRDFSLPSPLGLARGSRAMSPYFSGVFRVGKAVFMFPGCSLSQA